MPSLKTTPGTDKALAGSDVPKPLAQLSREAVNLALAGDIKGGLALAAEARHRAREAGDTQAELDALNAAARCHSLRNDSINALAAGIDAATLARTLGDGLALGHALCAIVNTAFILKLLAECEPFVRHAIRLAVEHGDADLECRARQTYGVLLSDLDRFDESRAEFARAVAAADRDGRPAIQLRVAGNLINVLRKQARYHAARGEQEPLQRVGTAAVMEAQALLRRGRTAEVLSLELTMTGLVGEVRVLMGDLGPGITDLMRAVEMATEGRHPSSIPPLVLMLAGPLSAEGRLDEARGALQRGLDVAETLRPSFRIAELCEAVAEVDSLRGAEEEASAWRQRAAQERQQFESSRQLAAAFLNRLQSELDATF